MPTVSAHSFYISGDVVLKNIFLKKPFFYTTLLLSVASMALWFIELCANIEAQTGFYYDRSSIGRCLLIAVLFLTLIFGFLWNRIARKKALLPINMRFDFSRFLNKRLIFAIAALGFTVNTFFEIYRFSTPIPSLTLTKTVSFFSGLTAILSAVSLVYFIFVCFMVENKQVATSALSIAPVAWIVLRIIRNFISFTTVYYIPKNLLNILYLCALLITTFSFCRLITGTDTSKGFKFFTIFAPITIVLGFVLSLPTIFGLIFNFDTVTVTDVFMNFIDLAMSVFFLSFCLHLYKEN